MHPTQLARTTELNNVSWFINACSFHGPFSCFPIVFTLELPYNTMSRSSLFKHVEVEDDGAPGPSATVGRVPNNVVPSDVVPMDVESDEKRIQREFIQKCVDPNRKPPV